MKKNYFAFSSVVLIAIVTLLQSNASGPASNGNRATGAPGDGASTCVTCHSGGGFGNVSVLVELKDSENNTVTEYVPEQLYDVDVTVTNSAGNPAGYGFQVISMSGNTSLNSFSDPGNGVKLSTSSSRQYAEHNSPNSGGSFTLKWTAPSPGTGDVDFYFGANAVNGNGNNGSDNATIGDVTFSEIIGDTTDTTGNGEPQGLSELSFNENSLSVYPNPAQNLVFVEGYTANGTINIYTINGSLVKSVVLNQNQFDVSELEAGIYFIQADTKLGKFVKL